MSDQSTKSKRASRDCIKVRIQWFADRKSFQLQWVDPGTGRVRTRSSKTDDPATAGLAAAVLEHKLNQVDFQLSDLDRRKTRIPGYVYLIAGAPAHFKIGKAAKPKTRMSHLQNGSSSKLQMVHEIPTNDMGWLEEFWHTKFRAQHIRGEWFELSNEDVARFVNVAVWNWRQEPVRGITITDPWYGPVK